MPDLRAGAVNCLDGLETGLWLLLTGFGGSYNATASPTIKPRDAESRQNGVSLF